ncbi:MAG: hypothetical protein AAGK05_17505, partial [Pseudomonadota bacterium]
NKLPDSNNVQRHANSINNKKTYKHFCSPEKFHFSPTHLLLFHFAAARAQPSWILATLPTILSIVYMHTSVLAYLFF